MKKIETPKEYYTCHFTKQEYHYTDFVLAKKGWLAVDNTRRHPISKIGKTINQALTNGLRVVVNGELVSIGNQKHPNYLIYKKHVDDVRKENNYWRKWLRVDLTKESFLRTYKTLDINPPDLNNLCLRGNRKSNNSDACLDFLNIPNDREHREVKLGKYFVDGFTNNIAIEFFGDYHHANPEKYLPESKIYRNTAKDKWKKDNERLNYITEKYNCDIMIIWENDWSQFIQNKTDKLKIHFNNKPQFILSLSELLY